MSFVRVKPLGWSINEKLTSGQMNQLDTDHADAVDKTGDTITGDVHVGSGAKVLTDSGGKIVNQNGGIIENQSGSNTNYLTGATATWQAGSFLTVTNGGVVTVNNSGLTVGGTSVFTVGGSVTTTFNGPISFNGAETFNGLVEFNENVTLTTAALFVASGSAIGVQGGAGISFANTAHGTWQSGSNLNIQSGASLNVAVGGAVSLTGTQTVNSGGHLIVAVGGDIQIPGTISLSNGGLWFGQSGSSSTYNSGSLVTFNGGVFYGGGSTAIFNSQPTFTAGLFVSAGNTQFNSIVNFLGTTTIVGGSARLKMTTRDLTRRYCLAACYVNTGFNYDVTNDTVEIGTGSTIVLPIIGLPNNSVIKTVTYSWTGTGNVRVRFWQNSVIQVVNTHTVPGTYTLSPAISADTSNAQYRLSFEELGSNIPKLTSVEVTCTVSEYDDW